MNCRKALEIITLVLDDEATREQEIMLRFHLLGCPSCRKALEFSRDIATITRSLQAPPPPSDLETRVREMLAREDIETTVPRTKRSALLALPAVAAMLVAIFIIPRSHDDEYVACGTTILAGSMRNEPKTASVELTSKSRLTTAPLAGYSRRSSLISF